MKWPDSDIFTSDDSGSGVVLIDKCLYKMNNTWQIVSASSKMTSKLFTACLFSRSLKEVLELSLSYTSHIL